MKTSILIFLLIGTAFASPQKYSYVSTAHLHEDDIPDEDMHPLDTSEEVDENAARIIQQEELTSQYWVEHGIDFITKRMNILPNKKKAKNVIMFLGDGMSHSTVAAARMAMGNENMKMGFEKFPYTASSMTYCADEQTADSACTATAFLHGVKGNSMTIGVNGNMRWNDCVDTNNKNKHTVSITKNAQDAGMATGFVTTARATHATPAGLYANTASRYWEDDSEVLLDRCDPDTIDDIAEQLIHGEVGSKLKVMLGGGSRNFIPNTVQEHGVSGSRRDGKNLIEQWLAKSPSTRTYVNNRTRLMEIDTATYDGELFGLFHSSHMNYNLDTIRLNRQEINPTLPELTEIAIELLSKDENGYFLFVESGRIDHGHHGTQARLAIDETLEFDKAINAAIEMVDLEETLVIVTADHSHVFTFGGYPVRGNDIFGLSPSGTQDGMPFLTLSYANGPGYSTHRQNNTRVDPRTLNREGDAFYFPATVPLSSETHGGEDVGIWSIGPWSHLIQGTVEQTVIPHVIKYATCIGDAKTSCDDADEQR